MLGYHLLDGHWARSVDCTYSRTDIDATNDGGSGSSIAVENVCVKICNWQVLWGILMTCGTRKLTKLQYQSMRIISEAFKRNQSEGTGSWREGTIFPLGDGSIVSLSHYSTLFKTYKPRLLRHLTVRAVDSSEAVDIRKAGATAKMYSDDDTPLVPVRTVLPSEYARADVGTSEVFELMCSTSLQAHQSEGSQFPPADDCVDLWPVVAAREFFYDTPRRIYIDHADDQCVLLPYRFAEPGDTICVSLLGPAELSSPIAAKFDQYIRPDGYAAIAGVIADIWPVHHISRKVARGYNPAPAHGLSSVDKRLRELLVSSHIAPRQMM